MKISLRILILISVIFFNQSVVAKVGLYVKGGLGFNGSSLIDKNDSNPDNAVKFFVSALFDKHSDKVKKHTPGMFKDSIDKFHNESIENLSNNSWNTKYTTAVVWQGAIGYNFWHLISIPVRTDLSYTRRFDKKFVGEANINANSTTIMLNGYVDLINPTLFTPYAMVGIGYTKNDWGVSYKFTNKKGSSKLSAFSLGGGLIIDILAGFAVDIGYKYTNSGNYDVTAIDNNGGKSTFEGKMSHHDVTLSVSFTL